MFAQTNKRIKRCNALALGALFLALCPAPAWGQYITGSIRMDLNHNGEIDAGDQTVGGIMVFVENSSGTFTDAYKTQSDGLFAFRIPSALLPDTFVCRLNPATLPAGATIVFPASGTHVIQLLNDDQGKFFDRADFLLDTPKDEPPPGEPPQDCPKLTGGGWIIGTPSGAKANFGVQAGIRRGAFWGGLNYIDHGTGLHVKSRAVTGVAFDPDDSDCLLITYDVTIDGEPGEAFVRACDKGEPGRNDTFEILLSNSYSAGGKLGGGRHGGGNIQMHKCPPGWRK